VPIVIHVTSSDPIAKLNAKINNRTRMGISDMVIRLGPAGE
jgi:hypothetical protein